MITSEPSLFDRLTREDPQPTIQHASFDLTRPWISRSYIAGKIRVENALHQEVAALAEAVEGVPVELTLSRLRTQAIQNIPALQPAAVVRSQSEVVAQRIDNVRTMLSELSDLQDEVFASPEKVSLRALLETLRHVEVELDAAVGRLAGELGLVAM
jgi:hypothetical protein